MYDAYYPFYLGAYIIYTSIIYVYIYIYMYNICVYIYTYIYIYIHVCILCIYSTYIVASLFTHVSARFYDRPLHWGRLLGVDCLWPRFGAGLRGWSDHSVLPAAWHPDCGRVWDIYLAYIVINIDIYIYILGIYIYTLYIYIDTYVERERGRERERENPPVTIEKIWNIHHECRSYPGKLKEKSIVWPHWLTPSVRMEHHRHGMAKNHRSRDKCCIISMILMFVTEYICLSCTSIICISWYSYICNRARFGFSEFAPR